MEQAKAPYIVAASPEMRAVLEETSRVAIIEPFPVHIRGESGTGKELIARRLHDESSRARGAFVAVNSAALPESLLEAELFGHTRGAFTGVERPRRGLVEEADGGTLFLDEVADLSPRAQSLLLRALQEREFRRVGESRARYSDFRVVTATHKNLLSEIEAGRFRHDLYFRLDVLTLEVPPLRRRRDDILPLARRVLAVHQGPRLSREAERSLLAYGWPGQRPRAAERVAAGSATGPRSIAHRSGTSLGIIAQRLCGALRSSTQSFREATSRRHASATRGESHPNSAFARVVAPRPLSQDEAGRVDVERRLKMVLVGTVIPNTEKGSWHTAPPQTRPHHSKNGTTVSPGQLRSPVGCKREH